MLNMLNHLHPKIHSTSTTQDHTQTPAMAPDRDLLAAGPVAVQLQLRLRHVVRHLP